MIDLGTLVWVVLYMLLGAAVLAILWFGICYFEREWGGPPLVWKAVKSVFVLLVILGLCSILLHLAGYPLVRFPMH